MKTVHAHDLSTLGFVYDSNIRKSVRIFKLTPNFLFSLAPTHDKTIILFQQFY